MKKWIQVSSGRGPEECRWVAGQVVKQMMNEAEQMGLNTGIVEVIPGDSPAALRSGILYVNGDHRVPEFVSSWEGTVQWVGQSMFRPRHKRKNWFVGVTVFKAMTGDTPDMNRAIFETMRSTGPGGQHLNKTESAVRAIHVPTGLSAVAREERSQHLNKRLALLRLEGLLVQKKEKEKRDSAKKRWARHNTLERGNPVRIFHGLEFKIRQ